MDPVEEHKEESPSHKRKYNTLSDDTHQHIIALHLSHHSPPEISSSLGLNYHTVRSIISSYQKTGQVTKKQKGGNYKAVYSDEVKNEVVHLQEIDPSLRLSDIREALKEMIPASSPPSLPTIHRTLEKAGFTTKHLYAYPEERNSANTKEKRKNWVSTVPPTLTPHLIFIDESPFSFCIIRGRGRSKKGKKAVVNVPQIRGKNHTVIAAISPEYGLIYYEIKVTEPDEEFIRKRSKKKKKTKPKGVTREKFKQFLINMFDLHSSLPPPPLPPLLPLLLPLLVCLLYFLIMLVFMAEM